MWEGAELAGGSFDEEGKFDAVKDVVLCMLETKIILRCCISDAKDRRRMRVQESRELLTIGQIHIM